VLAGTYRLERLIAKGGMGAIYDAVHLRVPRHFAVKLLTPEIVSDREIFERFRREAEIASALGHEHIVQAYDFNFSDDGVPYMVLELLQGEDLAHRITRRTRLTLAETASVLEQTADAVAAAHERGIVHRDLKPQNIFLCPKGGRDDFVKVLDFGISKMLHSPARQTQTGQVFGTPNYMAPEQAQGRQSEIDTRTDVFAMGAILYECLTGRPAFEAPTTVGVLYQVCHATPAPIASFAPEVPTAVEQVIARAMAKPREARQQDVRQLAAEFRAASQTPWTSPGQAPAGAPAPAGVAPGGPPCAVGGPTPVPTPLAAEVPHGAQPATLRLAPLVAIAVAAIALLVLAVAGFFLLRGRQAESTGLAAAAEPAATEPAGASAGGGAGPQAAEAPATVELHLAVTPPEAQVEVDGVATQQRSLRLPRSNEVHRLVVTAPGYAPATRDVRAISDGTIAVKLTRRGASPRPTERTKPEVTGGQSPRERDL
jgi:eukaryotic-like serine/threonine-protein kinase